MELELMELVDLATVSLKSTWLLAHHRSQHVLAENIWENIQNISSMTSKCFWFGSIVNKHIMFSTSDHWENIPNILVSNILKMFKMFFNIFFPHYHVWTENIEKTFWIIILQTLWKHLEEDFESLVGGNMQRRSIWPIRAQCGSEKSLTNDLTIKIQTFIVITILFVHRWII